MSDEQVTPWCEELCQRLEADLRGDYRAVWWAIDVFRMVRNAGRFSDDDENLECLTENPPNDATCARIASTLLKVLAAPHTDARTAAQAAHILSESSILSQPDNQQIVALLTVQLRRRVEEFMGANGAMASIVYSLKCCGERLGEELWETTPLETMRGAQDYLKQRGYDYVPW